MRNLKMVTAVAAVAVLMGMVGVSAASANYTFDGTISGSTWAGSVGPCDFSITSTTAPTTNGVLQGSTFAGRTDGANPPCDQSSLTITGNIAVTYTPGTDNATLGRITVDDAATGCTYKTGATLAIHNDTTHGDDGVWSGSGSATSSNFPCILAPATISVSGSFTT